MTRVLAAAVISFLLVIPFSYSQDSQSGKRMPATTMEPGSDLIAWTEMQDPEPVQANPVPQTAPEPRPETPAPRGQTPSSPSQSAQPEGQGQNAQPSAQTFSGTISKDGDNFVLKVSDTTSYKLDDQDQAKQFEGQKVRVFGSLDNTSNMIHVQKIEPLA